MCKTWSTQTKKKPTEAGAAAMASAAETDFEWGKEYEQGLGSELYEVTPGNRVTLPRHQHRKVATSACEAFTRKASVSISEFPLCYKSR